MELIEGWLARGICLKDIEELFIPRYSLRQLTARYSFRQLTVSRCSTASVLDPTLELRERFGIAVLEN